MTFFKLLGISIAFHFLTLGNGGLIALNTFGNISDPEFSCHPDDWTEYFNADDALGEGDFESLYILRRTFPEKICSNPTAADGRVRETLVHYSLSGQTVVVDRKGLVCKNENQVCVDYEVRFCCPKIPECINGEWTTFYNVEEPSEECDCEFLSTLKLKYGEKVCEKPTAIDARTSSDKIHWPYTRFKDQITVDNEIGFRCDNTISQQCDDFEVRFCCPTVFLYQCGPEDWTAWLNCDKPTGKGDLETLTGIDQTFPEAVCPSPSALEVRSATSGELFNLRTAPWNIVASTSHGFSCFNKPGLQCDDYSVRFCCPKENHIPDCKNGKWSDYFDIDDPSEYGDFETVWLIKQKIPDLLCDNWDAVDARLVGTDIHHPIRGQRATLTIEEGFSCKNEDNPPGCGDYEIRFCCLTPTEICEDDQWTDFFDTDNPNGLGDFEDISTHFNAYPSKLCTNPTAIDVRTESGSHYSVLNQNVHISLKDGFRCYNDQPQGQKCCDYKVRYCCPEQPLCKDECSLQNGTWTDFFDLDDPSTSSTDTCDCELLSDIRAQYPSVCEAPVAIDARLLNGDYYTVANQVVELSPTEGFKCLNQEQTYYKKCLDYKVRFCCSGGPTPPPSTTQVSTLSTTASTITMSTTPPNNNPQTCITNGDPHYRTFDGKHYHFQGGCTYELAKTTDAANSLQRFAIEVQNEHRFGNPRVSWVRETTIRIESDVIAITVTAGVLVNGILLLDLPYANPLFGYEIESVSTHIVEVSTNFGLSAWYTPRAVVVRLEGKYSGFVEGLCGNFNDDVADEFTIKDTNIIAENCDIFANSYRIGNASDPCFAEFLPLDCPTDLENQATSVCQGIRIDYSRCFRECMEVIDLDSYVEDCVFDSCGIRSGGLSPEDSLSNVLNTMRFICKIKGFATCEWSEWSGFGTCSLTCGGGRKVRTRTCSPEHTCPGEAEEEEDCNTHECPEWSGWNDFSSCSLSCGGGTKVRNRTCSFDEACPGSFEEEQDCNTQPCPEWSGWNDFSSCSLSCGGGTKVRNRTCSFDDVCPGSSEEEQDCNTQACPVCPPPPRIDNGGVNSTDSAHYPGDTLTYSCDTTPAAFAFAGETDPEDLETRCLDNGDGTTTWSLEIGPPECVPACAVPPEIEHASAFLDALYPKGTVLALSCNGGLVVVPEPAEVECQDDRSWLPSSSTFTCICPTLPSFPNILPSLTATAYVPGQIVTYACSPLHVISDPGITNSCDENGDWLIPAGNASLPQCNNVCPDPPPIPANAEISDSSSFPPYFENEVITYTCGDNLQFSSSSSTTENTCTSTGSGLAWSVEEGSSDLPTCVCPPLPTLPSNQAPIQADVPDTAVGESILYMCNISFSIVPPDTENHCTANGWSLTGEKLPNCLPDDPYLNIAVLIDSTTSMDYDECGKRAVTPFSVPYKDLDFPELEAARNFTNTLRSEWRSFTPGKSAFAVGYIGNNDGTHVRCLSVSPYGSSIAEVETNLESAPLQCSSFPLAGSFLCVKEMFGSGVNGTEVDRGIIYVIIRSNFQSSGIIFENLILPRVMLDDGRIYFISSEHDKIDAESQNLVSTIVTKGSSNGAYLGNLFQMTSQALIDVLRQHLKDNPITA